MRQVQSARTIWHNVEAQTTLPRPRPSLDPDELEFGSGDVSQLAQLTLRQLQWWDERKVISPQQERHRRVYHVSDVIGMMVIGELRRKGFSLQKLRAMVRALRRKIDRRLGELLSGKCELYVLTDGKVAFLEDQPDRIIAILNDSRKPLSLVSVGEQAKRLAEFQESASTSKRERQANAQIKLF
jgi:DNA-binding transcriptional MerR regulator